MFYITVLQLLDCLLDLGIGHIFFVFSNHYSRCLELIKNQFIVWKVSVFGVFLVRIFPHLLWIWGDMKYLFVFSPNADECGPEKIQIRTLSKQWLNLSPLNYYKIHWFLSYENNGWLFNGQFYVLYINTD